jgi:hypothetical protein
VFLEVYPQVLGVSTFKQCRKCGELKSADHEHFFAHSKTKDGLQPYCKTCDRAAATEWVKANRDRKSAYDKAYRASHKERKAATSKAYRAANRKRLVEYDKEKYLADPDKENARNKAWRDANREHLKTYRKNNRERTVAYNKTWREANPEKRRVGWHRYVARKFSLPSDFTPADWKYALEYFSGCCAACGRQPGLWHTLAADHWIPLTSPDCPGTVRWNMVPLCHGIDGCNNQKFNKKPDAWLIDQFGKRKGRTILLKIEAFLNSRTPQGGISA